jgi:hypothetical protein
MMDVPSYRQKRRWLSLRAGTSLATWLLAGAAVAQGPGLPPLPTPVMDGSPVPVTEPEIVESTDWTPPPGFDPMPPTMVATTPARRAGLIRKPRPSLPSPIIPDPQFGVLRLDIEYHRAEGCNPVLYGVWMKELSAAINWTPRLRVLHVTEGSAMPPGAELPPPVAPPMGELLGSPPPMAPELKLMVVVRSIDAYRPMRLDADLQLTDGASGTPLARLDGTWQAPRDSVPLRPTKKGWFRRYWHAPPAFIEEDALEAVSPQMFLRETAQRMAQTLSAELDQGFCSTAPVP